MEEPMEHWAKCMFDQCIKVPDNTRNVVESFKGLRASDINPLSYLRLSSTSFCPL